ncbi:hypothetical protein ACRAQ6_03025 [Erythrobacter sp. HA6-11]
MKRLALLIVLTATLAACGQQRPRIPDQVINRALAGAPGEAQPSEVVKAELEFARAARDTGQWTAFRSFAAPGAIIHGRNGPIVADPWLASQSNPEKAVQWEPRAVWMSCDGALAVSSGRFVDPEGLVGTYVTVWERQNDRSYKWTYDVASPDNPQPPAREPLPDLGPEDIVVTRMDSIRGLVAHCPRAGESVPAAPAVTITDDASQGGRMSRDGTLRWRWEHNGPGQRRVVVDWLTPGKWEVGLDQALPAPEE